MLEEIVSKFELHYHFEDKDDHLMDAVIRNRCEHQVLLIIGQIGRELGVQVTVECEPPIEGGYTEILNLIASVEGQAIMNASTLLLTIFQTVISVLPQRKNRLEKEDLRLSIEERKGNIVNQKLTNQILQEDLKKAKAIERPPVFLRQVESPDEKVLALEQKVEELQKELQERKLQAPKINIENINFVVKESIPIQKHKSNFYKTLTNYTKVKAVSTTLLDSKKKPVNESVVIERKAFNGYVMDSDSLEPIMHEDATIELIAPVIKKGKFKWKGIYKQDPHPIDFTMKDAKFKELIRNDGLNVKDGTFIDCTLQIERKIDDLGNIFNSNYSVLAVAKVHHDGVITETAHGRKKREKKEADLKQIELFEKSEGKEEKN